MHGIIKTPPFQTDWRAEKGRNPTYVPLYMESVGLNELQHLTVTAPNWTCPTSRTAHLGEQTEPVPGVCWGAGSSPRRWQGPSAGIPRAEPARKNARISQGDFFLPLQNMVVAQSKFTVFSTQIPLSIYLNNQSTGVCTYARPAVQLFQPEWQGQHLCITVVEISCPEGQSTQSCWGLTLLLCKAVLQFLWSMRNEQTQLFPFHFARSPFHLL